MPQQTEAQRQAALAAAGLTPEQQTGVKTGVGYSTSTTPKIGDIYGSVGGADANIQTLTDSAFGAANKPLDEAGIRKDIMDRLQKEVDATNNIYNTKVAEARALGVGRLGQTTAINARRGLAGSDFGAAITDKTNQLNADAINAVENERGAALAGLYSKGESSVSDEIAKQTAARTAGATNYINFLKESETRRESRNNTAAQAALAAGIDLAQVKPEELKKLADSYQIDPNKLLGTFKSLKDAQSKADADLAKVQAEAKAKLNEQPSLSEKYGTGVIGEYNFYAENEKANGRTPLDFNSYQNADANRKERVARAQASGGLTNYQQTQAFNHIADKMNSSPLIQAADRTPVLKASIDAIRANPSDAAQQLNLSYAYVQALDTYQSAVREGELSNLNSIDSKIGALSNSIQQMQNGQIVRPEVAKQIADAADLLVQTINSAAQHKAQSFQSQADVAGVGSQFTQYRSAFQSSYSPATNTGAPVTQGTVSSGNSFKIVEKK